MGKIHRWRNRPGHICIEIVVGDDDKWMDVHTEKELPDSVQKELDALYGKNDPKRADKLWGEIVIKFVSSGYYDPGRTYGDPYHCYPPEGDDERELDGLAIVNSLDGLSKKASQELFDFYEDEIYDVQIDTEPDEPEYEPDYDDELPF
jgi:hypothetical protein